MNLRLARDTDVMTLHSEGGWGRGVSRVNFGAGGERRPGGRRLAMRSAVLATLFATGLASSAQAQFFWPDDHDDIVAPAAPRRHKPVRHRAPKLADAPREATKPQGPVVITISIDRQRLAVYDANGLFAESPVSTGMRGHATPTGVFSILEKSKWHRSNLYSGAPMPYMQRITWSGVALHAGVLPGYPASHGCIRLPTNFAMRLWGWTTRGARVIITPAEITPADVSHPVLFDRKPEPRVEPKVVEPKPEPRAVTVALAPPLPEVSELRGGLVSTPKSDRVPLATSAAASPDAALSADGPKAATDTFAPARDGAAAADPDKDQPGIAVAAAPAAPSPATASAELIGPVKPRTGHIAAFVSRKTGRLYVRQNFEPLFDVPVTIADPDRPLGTHVFTLRADKDDPGRFRWSVVSLPPSPRLTRSAEADRPRSRKTVSESAAPLPPALPTANEALDRITIPDDAMRRIAAAIAPGGSIVISDQGLGEETGLGTDFIVPLR